MRRIDTLVAGLLWLATAALLPLAALEPANARGTERGSSFALGACADGSAHLALGCTSASL